MCDAWRNGTQGRICFYEWALQNGYSDDLSIDRINVNGNYDPENCRWATIHQQCNNTRKTGGVGVHIARFKNKTKPDIWYFRTSITINGKRIGYKSFRNPCDAIRYRKLLEQQYINQ